VAVRSTTLPAAYNEKSRSSGSEGKVIAMNTSPLTRIDLAILDILNQHTDNEVLGRELRRLLAQRGFRRSAPALVFTMLHLEDKGFIESREVWRSANGVEFKERYYRRIA
jgi:hypothetical protein